MATLEMLEAHDALFRHEAELESFELPNRCITCAPEFVEWSGTYLIEQQKKRGRNLSPHEQVEQRFYEFIKGTPMAYSLDYRKLDPLGHHIWELKTSDVRVFGWFARKGFFVAVCGELKDLLQSAKLYKPFIQKVLDFRNALNLDDPKTIPGVNHVDVL